MRKHALLIGLCLVLVLVFLGNAAKFYKIGLIQSLDAQLYDYRLRLTMPRTLDERIVIVDIDEKSLKEEGRWPWSKITLAGPDQQLPPAVRVMHGANRLGKRLHYYFNYSSELKSFAYPYAAGKDLLTGSTITHAKSITLKPWDVAIVEED